MKKKTKNITKFLLGIICILFPIFSSALEIPSLTNFVTDNANLLTEEQRIEIEQDLQNFEQQTSDQIVVLTVNSLEGDTIENFGIEVAKKNQVGDKDKDNGVILIVSKEDQDVRIEVGQGLEEYLTDAKSSYIIRHSIIPEFKQDKYYEGIKNGIEEIKKTASDANYLNDKVKEDDTESLIYGILNLVILVVLFIIITRRHKNNFLSGILFDQMFFHNNKGGGFGSGGFGSGGFHGGGGSFGGGGASGHW
ncbi:MAG TPA: TPM domain-containing protein [bacterium]|nr:TPM domain-containing protein [bacterium]HQL12207.1 TPM domain-containing protein [bacterium]